MVTAASVQDTVGGRQVLDEVAEKHPNVSKPTFRTSEP
jgi:hypothetical protein